MASIQAEPNYSKNVFPVVLRRRPQPLSCMQIALSLDRAIMDLLSANVDARIEAKKNFGCSLHSFRF